MRTNNIKVKESIAFDNQILLKADMVNKNHHIYTKEALQKLVDSVKNAIIYGYLNKEESIRMDDSVAACIMQNFSLQDSNLIGDVRILESDQGDELLKRKTSMNGVFRPHLIGLQTIESMSEEVAVFAGGQLCSIYFCSIEEDSFNLKGKI